MSNSSPEKLKTLRRNNWTIMVYLAGDNNLAEEMVYALKCMSLVGSNPQEYEVFALYDAGVAPAKLEFRPKQAPKASENIPVPCEQGLLSQAEKSNAKQTQKLVNSAETRLQNARAAEAKQKNQNAAIIGAPNVNIKHAIDSVKQLEIAAANLDEAKEELKAAKAAQTGGPDVVKSVQIVLEEFVVETIQKHPAEYYMLVLSGHGSGAVGDFLSGSKRLFGLSIPGLRSALASIQEKFQNGNFLIDNDGKQNEAKYLPSGKIDILGLDSCLMGMAELAYQVRDYVNFLVGAEGFEANTGWPYDVILNYVRDHPKIKPEKLAKDIVDQYITYYSSDFTLAGVSTDLTALDLGKIKKFSEELGMVEWLSSLFKTALKDKTTEDAILKRHGLLSLLKKAVTDEDAKTQDAILGGKDGLSNLLEKALTKEDAETKKTLLEAQAGLSNLLKTALTDKAGREAIEETIEKKDWSNLLKKLLTEEDRKAIDAVQKGEVALSNLVKMALGNTTTGTTILEGVGLCNLLKNALGDTQTRDVIKDAIVLAHWEAQGYKNEQHIDVWDFCDLLKDRCQNIRDLYKGHNERIADTCGKVVDACNKVKDRIYQPGQSGQSRLVLNSGYCGAAFQYSKGLSIFFPWANITDAANVKELDHYSSSLEFARHTLWDEFVSLYHQVTQRPVFNPKEKPDEHSSNLNRREGLFTGKPGRAGTETAAKAGTETAAKAGTETAAKAGTETAAKGGTGTGTKIASMKNPPIKWYDGS